MCMIIATITIQTSGHLPQKKATSGKNPIKEYEHDIPIQKNTLNNKHKTSPSEFLKDQRNSQVTDTTPEKHSSPKKTPSSITPKTNNGEGNEKHTANKLPDTVLTKNIKE